MRIGIDTRFAVNKLRGIGNYNLNLIRRISEIDCTNEYILYTDKKDSDGVLPKQRNFRVKIIYPQNYLIWEQILLPQHASKDGIHILHSTGNTSPINLDKKIILVTTIHDVSYLKPYSLVPKSSFLYQRLGRYYRKIIVPKSIKRVDAVITVSEFAENDICSHLLSLADRPRFVTYEAPDSIYKPMNRNSTDSFIKQKYNIQGEFILNVGGHDPQKNTRFVIENIVELKKKGLVKEKVVFAGVSSIREIFPDGKDFEEELLRDFIFIGFVKKEDLVNLYNSAKIFLFPSLYESFGLPLLESMACGTPVVASNGGAIPEISGNAALLFDPRNSYEFQSALFNILNDADLRRELIERGYKRASQFCWTKMAQDTLRIYETIFKYEDSRIS